MTFLAAIGKNSDVYGKPSLRMFQYFESKLNGEVIVNREESLYCGDAAGRKESANFSRDFSADDLLFGRALGVKFYTPEQFIYGSDSRMPNEQVQK